MDYLKPILKNGKAMILAYDHGFEHGPVEFGEQNWDPDFILDIAAQGGYTAVALQPGIAEKYWKEGGWAGKIPLILKLNGKTNLWKGNDYFSGQHTSVDFAKKIGASAVGYTIYLGSESESRMISEFGAIREQAHNKGIAAVAWIYPRGEFIANDTAPEIIEYAARAGLEIGADIVKIKYSNPESFKRAVQVAGKTRVVLSGGHKITFEEFKTVVSNVVEAGAAGIAVGRNIWQNDDPVGASIELKKIIWM